MNMEDEKPTAAVQYGHGHRGLYLGHVTTNIANGDGCTEEPVCKMVSQRKHDVEQHTYVFLDVKPFCLLLYHVDESNKVTSTDLFDLARISYCSGDHKENPQVFAWVYRHETADGFLLQTHAVLCDNPRKARALALKMNESFKKYFRDIQDALKSSNMLKEAMQSNGMVKSQQTRIS
ncbi:unnamed protein product [Owenia fusiformis]|uniref:Uncharacterized protein n=1 Tax=Owenia fusiformis TaxID=6347 RepID=A0A8J1UAY6_OWEFU|nr:unnamed protein product [Owenia fusiformis]